MLHLPICLKYSGPLSLPAGQGASITLTYCTWLSIYLQGKEPLLYVTVLLLSLQFQAALRFLWKDETTRLYRVDAVHLAIALHQEQALAVTTGEAGQEMFP